jgi:CRP-like cAMP-binding protein
MLSDRDEVEALRQVDLFAGLDSELLEALAKTAVVSEFEVGDQLVRQGTQADGMWVIIDGEVELQRDSKRMTTFGPGEIGGDVSLLSGQPHSVDVIAKTSGSRLILGMAEFRSAVRFHPDVAFEVIKVLASRFHELLEVYDRSESARQATNDPTTHA